MPPRDAHRIDIDPSMVWAGPGQDIAVRDGHAPEDRSPPVTSDLTHVPAELNFFPPLPTATQCTGTSLLSPPLSSPSLAEFPLKIPTITHIRFKSSRFLAILPLIDFHSIHSPFPKCRQASIFPTWMSSASSNITIGRFLFLLL